MADCKPIPWTLRKSGEDVFLYQNGMRACGKSGSEYPAIESVRPGETAEKIAFKPLNQDKWVHLLRPSFSPESEFAEGLNTSDNKAFMVSLASKSGIKYMSKGRKAVQPTKEAKRKRLSVQSLSGIEDDDVVPEEQDTTGKDIMDKYQGRFKVSAMTLQLPTAGMLCRPVSKVWVQQIKASLKEDPSLHATIIPVLSSAPLGTILTEENVSHFPLYTLGGNHLLEAIKMCLQEDDNNHLDNIRYVDVDVYRGLTLLESRRVGNMHNFKSKTREMCFVDGVVQARRLLLELTNKDPEDGEPPMDAPVGFRQQLLRQLGTSKAVQVNSVKSIGTMTSVAKYNRATWNALLKIINNLRQSRPSDLKALNQNAFRKFQGLDEKKREKLIQDVADKKLTFVEAGNQAVMMKKIPIVRASFVTLTGATDWNEVKRTYPDVTTEQELIKYAKTFPASESKKEIPEDFAKYVKNLESALSTSHDAVVEITRENMMPTRQGSKPTPETASEISTLEPSVWRVAIKVFEEHVDITTDPKIKSIIQKHSNSLLRDIERTMSEKSTRVFDFTE